MNHRRTAVGILAAAALALTACTADNTVDAKPKTTASKAADKPVASKHSTAETAYLTTTRSKVPALEKIPDAQLIDLGKKSCDAIDAGNEPAAVAQSVEGGLQVGDANSGYIVGAAVSSFCPEHKNKL